MSRPCKKRRVCYYPKYLNFGVLDKNCTEIVTITVDEFECLRLIDYEQLTQSECASRMNIARTTVTSIYQEVRAKIADVIVNGKKLVISGGYYEICPNVINKKERKEDIKMKIAVTYENEKIFQHFGKTEKFKVYEIKENGEMITSILDSNGAGHGALAGVLFENNIDVLICGGAGQGAINALRSRGIIVCAGVTGNCDEAVKLFINDVLEYSDESNCDHHGHEHHESHECHCGTNHKCGNSEG